MTRVLLTGVSGTGKSSAIREGVAEGDEEEVLPEPCPLPWGYNPPSPGIPIFEF
jgi:hypothetical protein